MRAQPRHDRIRLRRHLPLPRLELDAELVEHALSHLGEGVGVVRHDHQVRVHAHALAVDVGEVLGDHLRVPDAMHEMDGYGLPDQVLNPFVVLHLLDVGEQSLAAGLTVHEDALRVDLSNQATLVIALHRQLLREAHRERRQEPLRRPRGGAVQPLLGDVRGEVPLGVPLLLALEVALHQVVQRLQILHSPLIQRVQALRLREERSRGKDGVQQVLDRHGRDGLVLIEADNLEASVDHCGLLTIVIDRGGVLRGPVSF